MTNPATGDREPMVKFLRLIPMSNWTQPPTVWNPQYREALSGGLVRVGWGGRLALTDAGRAALSLAESKKP